MDYYIDLADDSGLDLVAWFGLEGRRQGSLSAATQRERTYKKVRRWVSQFTWPSR